MIKKNKRNVPVLVIDFGSQTTQLILRRIREIGVYCEVVSHDNIIDRIKEFRPKAIIFSGGPSSAFGKFSPKVDKKVFQSNIPILGICYGMQIICEQLNGKVKKTNKREFGKAHIKVLKKCLLFKGNLKTLSKSQVWMSHGDEVVNIPSGFEIIAKSENNIAAIANTKKHIYGLQFHPEVNHTLKGKEFIRNFILNISKIKQEWKINNFLAEQINIVKSKVGNNKVICGLSGGVDSSVVAALINKAIQDQLICIFVDHGLLRKDEEKEVMQNFKKYTNAKIIYVNAKKLFLKKLKGVKDPERKRKIIGRTFIDVFSKELTSLRTGRANSAMLDLIKVDVYGQQMPINQVGSITTPEPRMINIQVWDANNVPLVDAAIKKSDLGLNPQIDGQLIRLPVPELNEERRTELKKIIKSVGEKCKVSIRNIRREANEDLKKLLKAKDIGEDEEKTHEKKVQIMTDDHIKLVEEKVLLKEKEIMTI